MSETQNINVVETASKDNGQDKCPKCGSTDISSSAKTGMLRCNMCRNQFEAVKLTNDFAPISEGTTISSGMADISEDSGDMMTLKCTSCGAEVVIDTAHSNSARCHWCRNKLNINDKLANGATPDAILPFKIPKTEAQENISAFLKKRKFFADKQFKEEYTLDNIMGVYFPYGIADISMSSSFTGRGEHQTRQYTVTVGSGKNKHTETRYDADLYDVSRSFDLEIDDLAIETNADIKKAKTDYGDMPARTNNIINSILPFDTENCVQFDANYMTGYNSEKRDLNVSDIESEIDTKAKDISRNACNTTANQYDRGIVWSNESHEIKGKRLMAAYCPVWLYSYLNQKTNTIHYFAVNARTGETAGNVPLNKARLLLWSFIIDILPIGFDMAADSEWDLPYWIASGFIFYFLIRAKYSQENNRDFYEKETKFTISNLVKGDTFIKKLKGLSNPRIKGQNNNRVDGANMGANKKSNGFFKDFTQNMTPDAVQKTLEKKGLDF